MGLRDGTATAADIRGITQGDGGAMDRVSTSGGDGNEKLQGNSGSNKFYGGDGSDTFIVSAKGAAMASQGASLDFDDQFCYFNDFQGAGGWSATNNDFIAFSGFGAGSYITLTHTGDSGTAGASLYYYTITDGVSGDVVNFVVNSINGKALGAGDYAFY